MKRNLFEVRVHRKVLAAALVVAGAMAAAPAAAQTPGDWLPTGDDVASVIAGGPSPATDRFADLPVFEIELEREVAGSAQARWLQGANGGIGGARLSSRFGVRSDPFGRGHRMHAGVDLPLPHGASVTASAPGIVAFAGWAGGYGNMVEIDHGDGLRTRYAHLSRIDVTRFRPVASGQQVGRVGSTGRSTGSHLHYEVRVNGRPVDPLSGRFSLAARAQTNLLPWIAPQSERIGMRQTWSQPDRDGTLPQAILNQ